jgi:Protein of unknown function (DUF3040)
LGGGDEFLPLSEHEQRILHELEQSLYQEDPGFAERVRSETVYRHAGRYCIWSALVFVAALVFMFLTFSRSVVLGFVGVVVMFLSGVVFANNARRMGKAGIDDISRSLHSRNISNTVHDPRDWIRGRFHRED